jgi:hypothetical protein
MLPVSGELALRNFATISSRGCVGCCEARIAEALGDVILSMMKLR